MGKVLISMKVIPEGPEVDVLKIKDEISKFVVLQDSKIIDIGFGMKQLKILIVAEDKEGAGKADEIEAKIRKISGISEVEIEDVTLM